MLGVFAAPSKCCRERRLQGVRCVCIQRSKFLHVFFLAFVFSFCVYLWLPKTKRVHIAHFFNRFRNTCIYSAYVFIVSLTQSTLNAIFQMRRSCSCKQCTDDSHLHTEPQKGFRCWRSKHIAPVVWTHDRRRNLGQISQLFVVVRRDRARACRSHYAKKDKSVVLFPSRERRLG